MKNLCYEKTNCDNEGILQNRKIKTKHILMAKNQEKTEFKNQGGKLNPVNL